MPRVQVGKEKGRPIELFYQDAGEGQPVVLIHGWPLSNAMWESQIETLVESGRRVIAYDRRGFGASSWPWTGYDYDTLANDLNELLQQLDLRDTTLVGFSMAGGEVVRLLSNHGSERVSKAVLAGSVTPYMSKTDDNPEGIDQSVFDGILAGLKNDRPGFLAAFTKAFYNWNERGDNPISEERLQLSCAIASGAQPHATIQCAKAFSSTDFRQDLNKVDVPTLIVHGDADQTVPLEASGKRTADAIPSARFEVLKGAPHGFPETHAAEFNKVLLSFLNS